MRYALSGRLRPCAAMRVTVGAGPRRAGEFEAHQHCWMGWPDSPYLWREGARPAQEQYAAVAKAISQFEPLVMLTNPEVRRGAITGAGAHLCLC